MILPRKPRLNSIVLGVFILAAVAPWHATYAATKALMTSAQESAALLAALNDFRNPPPKEDFLDEELMVVVETPPPSEPKNFKGLLMIDESSIAWIDDKKQDNVRAKKDNKGTHVLIKNTNDKKSTALYVGQTLKSNGNIIEKAETVHENGAVASKP